MKNNKRIVITILLFLFVITSYLIIRGAGEKGSPQTVNQTSRIAETVSGNAVETMLETVTEAAVGIDEKAGKDEEAEKKEGKKAASEKENEKKTVSSKEKKSSKSNKKKEKNPPPTKTTAPISVKPTASVTPKPEETPAAEQKRYECSMLISCKTTLSHLDGMSENEKKHIPTDGILFQGSSIEIQTGDTVYSLVIRLCRERGIHLDVEGTFSGYIKGIENVYEKDFGPESGWMYRVNGKYPNVGIKGYKVSEGDNIELLYTCVKGDLLNG